MNKTNQMHNSLKILKTFIVLYCSTCFGHPFAHHQEPSNLHIQPPVTVCCWIGCIFQLSLSLSQVLYCSTCFGHPCAHNQEPSNLHIQPPVTVCCWIGCIFQLSLSLSQVLYCSTCFGHPC